VARFDWLNTIVVLCIGVNEAKCIEFNGLPSFLQLTVEVPDQEADMFDEDINNGEVFDFDELANQLLEQGLETSPAELHGALCGLLAAGAPAEAEAGLSGVAHALEVDLFGELAAQTMDLYRTSVMAMEDDEFDFYPLLPDDDQEIEVRTEALSTWCRGFLAGFAQATTGPAGGDSSEIISDLAAIADAEVGEDADEEELEASYAELVEYLRFAVLNVAMDNRVA
jgi:uncharacterized protein YgfB (UPF0149 family)